MNKFEALLKNYRKLINKSHDLCIDKPMDVVGIFLTIYKKYKSYLFFLLLKENFRLKSFPLSLGFVLSVQSFSTFFFYKVKIIRKFCWSFIYLIDLKFDLYSNKKYHSSPIHY